MKKCFERHCLAFFMPAFIFFVMTCFENLKEQCVFLQKLRRMAAFCRKKTVTEDCRRKNLRRPLFFSVGRYDGSKRLSLSGGRLFQFAVPQERRDTVQQEPSVRMEYKLQLIRFDLSEVCGNRFQYSLGIRRLQRIKVSPVLFFNTLDDEEL